jgi:hypothetical protein
MAGKQFRTAGLALLTLAGCVPGQISDGSEGKPAKKSATS